MTAVAPTTREVLNQLRPGDRLEIVQTVTVGMRSWKTSTIGTVERVERRRHGLHFRRNLDDKVFSDLVVLRLDDCTITTIAVDEFTDLRKL
ncbi:MAG TPA: hypothetical protein VML55_21960 [Planctomycetaceae bacterium]|nr:hypothetical protein [Planctomycetaceae bacterium]